MENKDVVIWGQTQQSKEYIQISVNKGYTVNVSQNEETIKDNDIVLYFQESSLTSKGFFDTTKLFEIVELWGYCFENGIPVTNKILVICCDTNPGDTKQIHEILNPMNINVCFLPLHNTNIERNRLFVGTLNNWVVSRLSSFLNEVFFDNIHLIEMTSTSSEVLNLGLSQSKLSQNLILENYKNILTKNSNIEELPLVEIFLNLKHQNEYLEDILRNEVLSNYILSKRLPNNVAKRVDDEKQKNVDFIISEFEKLELPTTTPIIIDGICFPNSNQVDYFRNRIITKILELNYQVTIVESESFIRGKGPKEMLNDFGDKVKFHKRGSTPTGYVLPL